MNEANLFYTNNSYELENLIMEHLEKQELMWIVEAVIQDVIQTRLNWFMSHNAAKLPENEKTEAREKFIKRDWIILISHFVYRYPAQKTATLLYDNGITNTKLSHQRISRILQALKTRISLNAKSRILDHLDVPFYIQTNISDEAIEELVTKCLETQVEALDLHGIFAQPGN